MKTKILAVVCVIALLIPSYLAVASYYVTKNKPIESSAVSAMELSDLLGQTYNFTSGEEDGNFVQFFLAMNSRAVKQTSLPEPLIGSKFFKVVFRSEGKEAVYEYYFSLDTSAAYFANNNGEAFQIKAEDAEYFLSTPCATCLYGSSELPQLFTISRKAIVPTSITWKYKNNAGVLVEKTDIPTTSAVDTFDMEGGISLDFDIIPDTFKLKIYSGGNLIFDDSYDKITDLSVDETTTLTFAVNAVWFEDATRDFCGEATYNFKANVVAPASFYISENTSSKSAGTVQPGEFVVITGVNVADISRLSFTSEPSINFTPTFFADGKYVRALVPISYDLTEKAYTFTVSYGVTSQKIQLSVEDKAFVTREYNVAATIANTYRTEATLAAFDSAMKPVAAIGDATKYFDGKFLEPVSGATITLGFGHFRTIRANSTTYRHQGVDYFSKLGADVMAINAGRVVYAGVLDLSGRTVVIEHGFGLKSWYCHMSEISVNVGDTVTTGQIIGKVGDTGFVNSYTLHLGLSVFNVPVCVYPVQDKGVIMYGE